CRQRRRAVLRRHPQPAAGCPAGPAAAIRTAAAVCAAAAVRTAAAIRAAPAICAAADRPADPAICLPWDDRLSGPEPVRPVAADPRLRSDLDAAGQRGMGTLPLRALGLCRTLGLDLDRRCALGLHAVPLWPLGPGRPVLGLVAGHRRGPPGLFARA